LDDAEGLVVDTLPPLALVTHNAALATVSTDVLVEKRAKKHAAVIARKQQAAVLTYNAALMTPPFSPPIARPSAAITPTTTRKRKLPAMPEVTADVLRQRQLAVDVYHAACATISSQ
jgi:hypothetical protein